MKGKLYGVGVGPGDPELITIKAINTIKKCGVVAYANAGNSERAALSIVNDYIGGKRLLECMFTMERDEAKRIAAREKAADSVCEILDTGEDTAFVTLGDAAVYSTYMYVHKIVKQRGYATQIIPGVPSFAAAAAALDISLCEGDEPLYIIPASKNENIDELLSVAGNKVIMKSGTSLNEVLIKLKQKGLAGNTKIVENCTMDNERIYTCADELIESGSLSYFSTAIVKE